MYRQINDKFIALTRANMLLTWSMLSGALIKSISLKNSFSDYELYTPGRGGPELDYYRKGYFNYVLLYKRKPLKQTGQESLNELDMQFYGK